MTNEVASLCKVSAYAEIATTFYGGVFPTSALRTCANS